MNAQDLTEFGRLFDKMHATWAKPSPNERMVEAAIEALDAFDIDTVATSIKALIAAGGEFCPRTPDIVRECHIQQRRNTELYSAARAAAAASDVDADVCPRCDGCGQVEQRQDTYVFVAVGHQPQQKTRSYWAPCPACPRGRRLAHNRKRQQDGGYGHTDAPQRRRQEYGAA